MDSKVSGIQKSLLSAELLSGRSAELTSGDLGCFFAVLPLCYRKRSVKGVGF